MPPPQPGRQDRRAGRERDASAATATPSCSGVGAKYAVGNLYMAATYSHGEDPPLRGHRLPARLRRGRWMAAEAVVQYNITPKFEALPGLPACADVRTALTASMTPRPNTSPWGPGSASPTTSMPTWTTRINPLTKWVPPAEQPEQSPPATSSPWPASTTSKSSRTHCIQDRPMWPGLLLTG